MKVINILRRLFYVIISPAIIILYITSPVLGFIIDLIRHIIDGKGRFDDFRYDIEVFVDDVVRFLNVKESEK